MDQWAELLDVVMQWSFLPLGAAILLLGTLGAGLRKTRWERTAWVLGLLLLGATLYLGVERHEWGEVLFNGQLL